MLTQSSALELARNFITELDKEGIPVSQSYLFGSFATGTPTEYSDVDLALISEKFNGIQYFDRKLFSRILIDFVDLEPHTFRPQDFNENFPFAKEILRTGIKII